MTRRGKAESQNANLVHLTLVAALLVVTSATCTGPREVVEWPSLPAEVEAFLMPDSVSGFDVREGVSYRYVWTPRGPWAVHLLSADLSRCDLSLAVVPGLEEDGTTRRLRRISEMRPTLEAEALAGVNGDFFLPTGSPSGPEVTASTRRAVTRPAFAWLPGQEPWIGTPKLDEEGATFGAGKTSPARARTPAEASTNRTSGLRVVGGFPELLDGGLPVGDEATSDNPTFARARHPRTAVGFDSDLTFLWLVVVDGRQGGYSGGISLPELTDLLLALGVEEALNLDGGGSSTMLVRDSLVNRPSDDSGERPVANSLWVTADDRLCATG